MQKEHTHERAVTESAPVERFEERAARRLRLRIERLEARIAPDTIGDTPVVPPAP